MPDIAGAVVSHIIGPVHEQAFIDWSKRMGASVRVGAGFRSIIRFDQGSAISHMLVQFDSQDQPDIWLRSEAIRLLRAEGVNYSSKTIKPHVGQISVANTPKPATAPKWKQAAAKWFGAYPTLVAVNILMIRPLSGSVNWLVLLKGSLVVLTVILTFVILPRVQRALRPWMFADSDKENSR